MEKTTYSTCISEDVSLISYTCFSIFLNSILKTNSVEEDGNRTMLFSDTSSTLDDLLLANNPLLNKNATCVLLIYTYIFNVNI
jgi:hypothetical protein